MKTTMTLLCLPLGAAAALAADGKRPNIVFAFGDDYGRYASAYADADRSDKISRLIETPNFDRVAREGVLMMNCYAPAPSSTPCRSSLLSGQYFWRTGYGAILQGAQWDDSISTFPLLLEQNGYDIGYTYKVWSPGTPKDQPYGGERTRFAAHGNKWAGYSIYISKAADKEKAHQALLDEVRGNFGDFLSKRSEGRPFCYWWGPTNTHRQWQKGSGKALWGIDPDDLKGRMPSFLPDVPEIREDMSDYLGECLAFDEGLGVIMDMLEEIGELDNTIIVVSGDHGIPGFPRGKCNLYELGTHIGMAVRYPAAIPAGRTVDDMVSLMDLAPTFLDYGEVEIPEVMTGRSFRNVLESPKSGQVDPTRDYVVTGRERHVRGARHGCLPYPHRAIATQHYMYIRNFEPTRWPSGTYKAYWLDLDEGPTKAWYHEHYFDEKYAWHMQIGLGLRPYEELYDLDKDPDQIHNLAFDPKYQKIRKNLSDRLEKVLTETGDPRMSPGLCIYDSEEFFRLIPTDKNYPTYRVSFNESQQ